MLMTVPRGNSPALSDQVRRRLLERIDQDDLTVTDLAGILGYGRSTVSRWVNGRSVPSSGLVDAAAAFLARSRSDRL